MEPLPKREGYSNDESTSDEDILSILNVVVDYVMVRPTPLEPDEFSWELQRKMPRSKADIFLDWHKVWVYPHLFIPILINMKKVVM